MSSFNLLIEGFATALTLTNLMYGLLGTFLGTLVGVLPGIGPALAIALLLPVTASIDPTAIGIGSYPVPGTKIKLRCAAAVAPLLVTFAAEFHQHIEPIDEGVLDDWGYCYRNVRGSSDKLSNHSSGTASLSLNKIAASEIASQSSVWLSHPRNVIGRSRAWISSGSRNSPSPIIKKEGAGI